MTSPDVQVMDSVTLHHTQKEGKLLARQGLVGQFCIAQLQCHIRHALITAMLL